MGARYDHREQVREPTEILARGRIIALISANTVGSEVARRRFPFTAISPDDGAIMSHGSR